MDRSVSRKIFYFDWFNQVEVRNVNEYKGVRLGRDRTFEACDTTLIR